MKEDPSSNHYEVTGICDPWSISGKTPLKKVFSTLYAYLNFKILLWLVWESCSKTNTEKLVFLCQIYLKIFSEKRSLKKITTWIPTMNNIVSWSLQIRFSFVYGSGIKWQEEPLGDVLLYWHNWMFCWKYISLPEKLTCNWEGNFKAFLEN